MVADLVKFHLKVRGQGGRSVAAALVAWALSGTHDLGTQRHSLPRHSWGRESVEVGEEGASRLSHAACSICGMQHAACSM